ncbi:hypothetical protein FRB95_008840 [Tulasnella sp. JGI-2019a]|nr:hypothetical protein FRB93_007423 [Tulasnella sp. JGI-2019a]KAG9026468.1 hypothetical protein FRB95_008840 [Tulasnella sp. JGI-2019a]
MDYTIYEKDPDYYFSDGNICIAAEKALFRVHRGVLVRHSTVFRDLFDIPRPLSIDGSDNFEGVAVVNLPETSDEVRMLLKFVYGDIPCCQDKNCSGFQNSTFEQVENILRISHKYDVTRSYECGLQHLRQYPSVNDSGQYGVRTPIEWSRYKDPAFLVHLIKLTQLFDRRELDGQLALAYYAMSVVNWETHDQGIIYQQLDPSIISRLASGRSRMLSRSIDIIRPIVEHQCEKNTFYYGDTGNTITMRSTWHEESCRKAKAVVIGTLMSELHRDFAHALVNYCPPEVVPGCEIDLLVHRGVPLIFDSIIKDFGL